MKTFHVKFQRDFEVDVQAEDLETAKMLANQVLAQFPKDSTKILSIIIDGYVEPAVVADGPEPVAEMSEEAKKVLARNEGLKNNIDRLTE